MFVMSFGCASIRSWLYVYLSFAEALMVVKVYVGNLICDPVWENQENMLKIVWLGFPRPSHIYWYEYYDHTKMKPM